MTLIMHWDIVHLCPILPLECNKDKLGVVVIFRFWGKRLLKFGYNLLKFDYSYLMYTTGYKLFASQVKKKLDKNVR